MSFRHIYPSFIMLLTALILIASPAISETKSDFKTDQSMGTLVTTEWLSRHLDDPDLIVIDCTVKMIPKESGGMQAMSGRADFEAGHIPSAIFADLLKDLSDTNSSLGFALPTPEQFCSVMGKLGVGDNSKVVLYDSFNSVWAARVWWMLKWIGFDRAAILDGGLRAWKAEERHLSTELSEHRPKHLTPNPHPSLIAYHDEVFNSIGNDKAIIIDAMPEAHFRGQMALYGRPGHIPGAINIPATDLLDEAGRFRSNEEYAALFNGDRKARAITYCGAGVAASLDAFIMSRLGFTDVAVYMGSLQEWTPDSANPLVIE